MRINFLKLPLLVAVACGLAACATPDAGKTAATPVPEIRPGILQGYLPMDVPFNSVEFVPPAPREGGPLQTLDDEVSAHARTLRYSQRWEMAKHDAHLGFPGVADTFSCALDLPVNERDTPALYMLLRRTLADVALATYSAKNAYARQRPFMVNGEPTCTPEEEEMLRHDGSYPSGHTSIGWGWALILSELAPDRAEAVLARGRAFGESRIVCNAHWYSDVVAGRMVAAGAVARLRSNPAFLEAMAAAGADIASARKRGLTAGGNCAQEQEDLSFDL